MGRRALTTTSYAILGLLSLQPWSAYELAQQMRRSLRFCWPRAERGVYDEPKVLVEHGLASSTIKLTGERKRTVYSITPAGRRALRRWLAQPSSPPEFESEALLRVQFIEHSTAEDAVATLRELGAHASALRRQVTDQGEDYLRTGGPFPRRLHVIAVTGKFLLDYARLLEDWAAWAEQQIERWPRFGPLPPDQARQLFEITLGDEFERARRAGREAGALTPDGPGGRRRPGRRSSGGAGSLGGDG